MKNMVCGFLIMMVTVVSITEAQENQPFVVTVSGGLFFPAEEGFQHAYQASSDLLWSVGVAWPASEGIYVTAEYGKFTSKGFFDATVDSGAQYDQKIIHIGTLVKQPLSRAILLRISAGVNRVNVRQITTSPRITEKSIETGTLYGFYGGIGVEESLGDPHAAAFAEVVYDYSRSHDVQFPGDFGGLRIAVGLNIILF